MRRVLGLILVGSIAIASAVLVWTDADDRRFRAAVTVVITVVALVILIDPGLFTRLPIESLKLPLGLEIGFRSQPEEEEERDVNTDTTDNEDVTQRWLNVRWRLEAKLAYLSKHTLPDHLPYIDDGTNSSGTARPFANIGSLKYDGWLNIDDAKIATVALTLSPGDLALVQRDELNKSLVAAENLARVIRARVFQALVERYIKQHEWVIESRSGLRWTVTVSANNQVLFVPVFGPVRGDLVKNRVNRLADQTAARSLVVIPNYPKSRPLPLPPAGSTKPSVVRFSQIGDAIERLRFRVTLRVPGRRLGLSPTLGAPAHAHDSPVP